MNLQDVRNAMSMQRGGFKAFALRKSTFANVIGELGLKLSGDWLTDRSAILFDFPVVFVGEDQPEGVIV